MKKGNTQANGTTSSTWRLIDDYERRAYSVVSQLDWNGVCFCLPMPLVVVHLTCMQFVNPSFILSSAPVAQVVVVVVAMVTLVIHLVGCQKACLIDRCIP